ncbi:membrane protein [Tropheryma whipplei]|uniref:Integral membrane protein n=1 Tax=Tropheryma whipplei (strain Twist) TaxID=203267 RepID=Q83GH7_TROWT|nr:membrane protein [Tropheryma whipplei]AAO44408.1 unknown [Tropheryma whipplei str. Twist]MCO8182428.1 hypothetical protein [Tropheryma whipplei]MCO8190198.1 hypothetical protein [Tropheryma whipplei]
MPSTLIGTLLAIISLFFVSFGTHLQNLGVKETFMQNKTGLHKFVMLFKQRLWVLGAVLLAIASILQVLSLVFAPLVVVQPLGALAIVISVALNSIHQKKRGRAVYSFGKIQLPVLSCVTGVGLFVLVAALFAEEKTIDNKKITVTILVALSICIVLLFLMKYKNFVLYIVAAGIMYGLVVTFTDTVIGRIQAGFFNVFALFALFALFATGIMGAYMVQKAHGIGSPDLVVAGLTVIDPIVAVVLGAIVLGEIDDMPVWGYILMLSAGCIAIWGVLGLCRIYLRSKSDL